MRGKVKVNVIKTAKIPFSGRSFSSMVCSTQKIFSIRAKIVLKITWSVTTPWHEYMEFARFRLWALSRGYFSFFLQLPLVWESLCVIDFPYFFVLSFRNRDSHSSQQSFKQSTNWCCRFQRGFCCNLWGEDTDPMGHECGRAESHF